MSDTELLYRRAMCGPKPYCFLMNTHFPTWSYELTEKFMKRSLAYGCSRLFQCRCLDGPLFFAAGALQSRPTAVQKISSALQARGRGRGSRSPRRAPDQPRVYVERFGKNLLTVFHDDIGAPPQKATVTLEGWHAKSARELVTGQTLGCQDNTLTLTLAGEDVAVLELE